MMLQVSTVLIVLNLGWKKPDAKDINKLFAYWSEIKLTYKIKEKFRMNKVNSMLKAIICYFLRHLQKMDIMLIK